MRLELISNERMEEIQAMLEAGFFGAPGNATVAQLLDERKRLLTALAEAKLLISIGNEAAREQEYAKQQAIKWNDEAVRLRRELEKAQQQSVRLEKKLQASRDTVYPLSIEKDEYKARWLEVQQSLARQWAERGISWIPCNSIYSVNDEDKFLVTDGKNISIGGIYHYGTQRFWWADDRSPISDDEITHYAVITLPGADLGNKEGGKP